MATASPASPAWGTGVGALLDHAVVGRRWMSIQAYVALVATLRLVSPRVAQVASALVPVVADGHTLSVCDVSVSFHPGVAFCRGPPRRRASRGLGPRALAVWSSTFGSRRWWWNCTGRCVDGRIAVAMAGLVVCECVA